MLNTGKNQMLVDTKFFFNKGYNKYRIGMNPRFKYIQINTIFFMKHTILSTALFCCCSAFTLYAQTDDMPTVHGYWEGSWLTDFSYNIYLETDANGKVTGVITWSLSRFDRSTKEMVESNPKEFVEGTYNNKTGVLNLKTVKEEDPYEELAPGVYYFKMMESGAEMKGYTNGYSASDKIPITMSRMRT
ncbi:MAG: hypothetical protein RIR11_4714 [Bacteroidota bacterium]